jgi:hypothetical protein
MDLKAHSSLANNSQKQILHGACYVLQEDLKLKKKEKENDKQDNQLQSKSQ